MEQTSLSFKNCSFGLLNGWFDWRGQVFVVLFVDARHGDSATLQQVNVVLVNQDLALFSGQPCEWKHSNLVGDMVPSPWRANSFQLCSQQFPHLNDSVSHIIPQLSLPLSKIFFVVQDFTHNQSSMQRRIRVHFTSDDSILLSKNT